MAQTSIFSLQLIRTLDTQAATVHHLVYTGTSHDTPTSNTNTHTAPTSHDKISFSGLMLPVGKKREITATTTPKCSFGDKFNLK